MAGARAHQRKLLQTPHLFRVLIFFLFFVRCVCVGGWGQYLRSVQNSDGCIAGGILAICRSRKEVDSCFSTRSRRTWVSHGISHVALIPLWHVVSLFFRVAESSQCFVHSPVFDNVSHGESQRTKILDKVEGSPDGGEGQQLSQSVYAVIG